MKIISVASLKTFWEKYPDAEQPLKAWFDEAKKASWKTPAEIKTQYRNASILKNNRVVSIQHQGERLPPDSFHLLPRRLGVHKIHRHTQTV
nr:type II toxin-antitoxin system HigB family toxin [Xenorhabdus kozodoii]